MSTEPRTPSSEWKETYLGGSEQAEREMIESWTLEIQELQVKASANGEPSQIRRGLHAKQHIGVDNAEFVILDDIPEYLQVGPFTPGARYQASVRISNGRGDSHPDHKRDLRGLAVRLRLSPDTIVDLLATSGAVSFARDSKQFMDFARASSGPRAVVLPSLVRALGLVEAIRILRTVAHDTGSKGGGGLAAEQFWSRGAYQFGELAIRFTFAPLATSTSDLDRDDPDHLRSEFVARLRTESVSWDFEVQFFFDEATTPIEDAAVGWDSEYIALGRLTIPSQDLSVPALVAVEDAIDAMKFNPWNTTDDLRPLGSINRARRRVYQASQDGRSQR